MTKREAEKKDVEGETKREKEVKVLIKAVVKVEYSVVLQLREYGYFQGF